MLRLFHSFLKIDPREVEFARRGFVCSRPAIRERLEHVGRIFLRGYHAALGYRDQKQLAACLDQTAIEYRGFAYEGAAMALALQDGIDPWNQSKRFANFVAGPGRRHIYMLHVGAGWAMARLPWLRGRIESIVGKFHPVFGWLAVDGYGFHEGYFHWHTALQSKLSKLSENARHIFYQGLGRSLWFVNGADVSLLTRTISTFALQFHADAWSGLGLGCGYAGGITRAELEELHRAAGPYRAAVAQGAAFAAKARQLAGNPASHTELACKVLCGISTEEASALCDSTFEQATQLRPNPYQKWRELLQNRLQAIENRSEVEIKT